MRFKYGSPIIIFILILSSILGVSIAYILLFLFYYDFLIINTWIAYIIYSLGITVGLWQFRHEYLIESKGVD